MGHQRTLWSDGRALFAAVTAKFEPVLDEGAWHRADEPHVSKPDGPLRAPQERRQTDLEDAHPLRQRGRQHPPAGRMGAAPTVENRGTVRETARSRASGSGGLLPVRRYARTRCLLVVTLVAGVLTAIASSELHAAPQSVRWVALGDSYSAGVGLGPVGPEKCDRDAGAYARLAKDALASAGQLAIADFRHIACKGAVTGDYWNNQHNASPYQNDGTSRQRDAVTKNTNLVTLTLGGNDISFAEKIAGCVIGNCGPDVYELSGGNGRDNPLDWDGLYNRLLGVYLDVRQQMSPSGHLFVLSYPIPFSLGHTGLGCNLMSAAEKLAANALSTRLGDTIFHAVNEANRRKGNVHFVDWRTGTRLEDGYEVPSGYAGAGRRFPTYSPPDGLCNQWGNTPQLNGLVPALLIENRRGFSDNSFHPTPYGYRYAGGQLRTRIASAFPSVGDPGPPTRGGLEQYAGHIVQWDGDQKAQKTAWYVTPDLKRLWIPDTDTYHCLKRQGAPGPDRLPARVLDQLPDQNERWAPCGDSLYDRRSLRRDMSLSSGNGRFSLRLQRDGNLVLYAEPCRRALWATNKFNTDYVWMQRDGNVVAYTANNQAVWSTNTRGSGANRFVVQDDGNLVLYAAGTARWASNTVQPGSNGCRPGSSQPNPPPPPSGRAVTLARGPSAPAGYWYAVTLRSFGPFSTVAVSCHDSKDPGGFRTFSLRVDGSGSGSSDRGCYSGDGPDHWVRANGIESNHVQWGPGSSSPAPPPPAPGPGATYTQQSGSRGSPTFRNPVNASGPGERIPPMTYVQVSCKVKPATTIASAYPDGYWYRIASTPWNDEYYAVANTFWNGDIPGQRPYTHNTDFSVPDCGAPPTTTPPTTTPPTTAPPPTTPPTTRPTTTTPPVGEATWSRTGSMSAGRQLHTATLLQSGKVLAAGYAGNTAELYDPATGTWSETGSMVAGRYLQTATLLADGKVLVTGGVASDFMTYLASAELYDPATAVWSTTGSMITARRDHTATLLPDGKVLVTGGLARGTSTLTSAELYDPATGMWSAAGNMTTDRSSHTATLVPNGKVLIAGGVGAGDDGSLSTAELYDPATGTWSTTGGMVAPRGGHTATLLPNGRVLVAGRSGDNGPSAELYDPSTGTWSTTGAMLVPRGGHHSFRGGHTATLLHSGKVLVAGGVGGPDEFLSGAELYDPVTGAWSNTSSMGSPRTLHAATLLSNGSVLVSGGGTSSLGMSDAEVYR